MIHRWLCSLTARIAVLLLVVCCCLSLFYLLACKPTASHSQQVLAWSGAGSKEGYMALLQEREDSHKHYINSLNKQIAQLKEALQERSQQLQESLDKAKARGVLGLDDAKEGQFQSDLKFFFRSQLSQSEVNTGVTLPNEFAVIPFDTFTLQRVYQLQLGLTRNPEQRPIRKDHRDELTGALETALHVLNSPQQNGDSVKRKRTYSPSDFIEGLTRTEKTRGTVYDLTFKGESTQDFRQLMFFRPFGPMVKVKSETVDARNMLVNIIVPLSKRIDTFRQFMSTFREVCILQDGMVHLTVVYFGQDQIDQVKATLDQTTRETLFRNLTLIQLNEEFSRGRGLEVGAQAWRRSQNVLLFFCDVDVHFTSDFLSSCRLNTEAGKKVYYPVLFSQYNPAIVYSNQTTLPPFKQQLVIKKDTGFWRDFGFGMTCQYRSDFIKIGGFDRNIRGWGMEDVHLYRKYLHSKLMVIRSPSRSLFHLWHEKHCADDLPTDKYKMCMQTKAMSEASHSHLGELLFKEEIEAHTKSSQKRTTASGKTDRE